MESTSYRLTFHWETAGIDSPTATAGVDSRYERNKHDICINLGRSQIFRSVVTHLKIWKGNLDFEPNPCFIFGIYEMDVCHIIAFMLIFFDIGWIELLDILLGFTLERLTCQFQIVSRFGNCGISQCCSNLWVVIRGRPEACWRFLESCRDFCTSRMCTLTAGCSVFTTASPQHACLRSPLSYRQPNMLETR